MGKYSFMTAVIKSSVNHKFRIRPSIYSTVRYIIVRYSTVQYSTVLYSTLQYSTVYRRPYSKIMVDTTLDKSGHKCINKLRKKLGCKIFNELCSKRHSD